MLYPPGLCASYWSCWPSLDLLLVLAGGPGTVRTIRRVVLTSSPWSREWISRDCAAKEGTRRLEVYLGRSRHQLIERATFS
jgi:hypothetical protein